MSAPLATLILLIPERVFFRGALRVFHGGMNMDDTAEYYTDDDIGTEYGNHGTFHDVPEQITKKRSDRKHTHKFHSNFKKDCLQAIMVSDKA